MRILSRTNESIFYILGTALALLAIVLSSRYSVAFDVTRESRNSLSARSQAVVSQLQEPAVISLYAGNNPVLLQSTRDLVSRYQRASSQISFEHKNIELDPSLSRTKNIERDGEIMVTLGDREKRINVLSETAISDALSTLLIRADRRLVFSSGHGERRATGQANDDMGEFSHRLSQAGYRIETLADNSPLPAADNNTVVVIASPEREFSATEQLALTQYLQQGGNLLWLQDASGFEATKTLGHLLPVSTLPGVIVDSAAQKANLPSPDFSLGQNYSAHAALQNISDTSLFPRAVALHLQLEHNSTWRAESLLQSSADSWNEIGEISGNIQPDDKNEKIGPLHFAYAFERSDGALSQRVVVVGDGDFLANNWLGNGANVALGEQLLRWLSHTNTAAVAPATAALDRRVEIPQNLLLMLAAGLLGLLPISLFGVAGWQWRQSAR